MAFSDFTKYYADHLPSSNKFSRRHVQKAQNLHYVLVPGILGHYSNFNHYLPTYCRGGRIENCLNLFTSTYFKEMQEVIFHELGSNSSIFYRDARAPISQTSQDLSTYLRHLHARLNSKQTESEIKLVVICHSKGGKECAESGLSDLGLLFKEQIVDHMVSVQAPIMGCRGVPENLNSNWFVKLCNLLVENIEEISPLKTIARWEQIRKNAELQLSSEELNSLKKKLFFIGSTQSEADTSLLYAQIANYLSSKPLDDPSYKKDPHFAVHAYDGLIRLRESLLAFDFENQQLTSLEADFGTFAGYIPADHCALFVGGCLARIKSSDFGVNFFQRVHQAETEGQEFRKKFARIFLQYFLDKEKRSIDSKL